MAIEIGRKYQMVDGHQVRIYSIDAGGYYPVHGAYLLDDKWKIYAWTIDGRARHARKVGERLCYDLIEIKPSAIDQMIEWMEREYKLQLQYAEDISVCQRLSVLETVLTEARRIKADAEMAGRS